MPTWSPTYPADRAWKAPSGLDLSQRAAEQDAAAGGHQYRLLELCDGRTVCASVALRVLPKSRRVYAYLRWSDLGKTHERYLGPVDHATRLDNLRQAWNTVAATTAEVTIIGGGR